jgi:hypothetical protein
MSALQWLGAAANVSSIATAVIAASASGWYLYQRYKKRLRLENYLKTAKENAGPMDSAQRTPLQLMVALGLTEAEIVDLSFRSRCIRRVAGTMEQVMGLEYSAESTGGRLERPLPR